MKFIKKITIAVILILVSFIYVDISSCESDTCHYCGMNRSKFGYSWIVIERDNTPPTGVCSVHCAAIDLALNSGKPASRITVGDYNTEKQIDADKAFWVIGGDRVGVMTSRAKWAFETKEGADNFIRKHGGRAATFSESLKAAFEDMYEDILMIQKKRRMMKIRENF
jgi:nitrous oxide reductase accessory protein NosL